MQDAKDTFYMMLRGRVASLNAQRTIAIRDVTRTGVLVDENEAGDAVALQDAFHLRWTGVSVSCDEAVPLLSMVCEIGYSTEGIPEMGGLDRGRTLAAMDGELMRALQSTPQNTPKLDFRALPQGGTATTLATQVWWSDPEFGQAKTNGPRLSRTVQVHVMSLMEDGEV